MEENNDIPILDLQKQYSGIRNMIEESIHNVLSSGQYVLGPEVKAFENEFAFFLKSGYVVGVNSGTDALTLALRAYGIGPGDEVITTPVTFIATTEAIVANGATPVYVDVRESDSNINADLIEAKITKKTKAILPVHLYGFACDMEKIMAIAKKHSLIVIEDCAQAVGAYVGSDRVGHLGDAGCYSFYPTKNLSAFGDAGAISTSDEKITEKLRALRAHGSALRGSYDMLGVNSRLDEIQATVLRVKLLYLGRWNSMRRKLATAYDELLAGVKGVRTLTPLSNTTPVYCLYTIAVKNRENVQEFLAKDGITSVVHYPVPLHRVNALKHLNYKEGDFPVSEKISAEILALPMYPELTFQMQERIVECIKRALKANF